MDLEEDEFRGKVKEATSFDELLSLFKNQERGELEDFIQLIEKALPLATTSSQAIDLWQAMGGLASTPQLNFAVLERMIELIRTEEDLQRVYYVFGVEERELERRCLIRKIFDKADELGYPTI